MEITFLGAAKTVTGSCYLVETEAGKFLVDCGMFQGHSKEEETNRDLFPFNPADIDFVLLTHSHIDHSGRIPKLYLDGFNNSIIATKPTTQLCGLMLADSGHIQEIEAEWLNRKRLRAGKPPVMPLYTHQDAVDCMKLFKSVSYGEVIELNDNIKVRFNDAGHLLGSSILEVWVRENRHETKVVFSGDLGNQGVPLLRDPSPIDSADILIIESTYGNRLHEESVHDDVERFMNIINETIEKGGNVIIPSFAVGRTQEIIYELNKHFDNVSGKVKKVMNIPVFVDSPLAVSATMVYRDNLDCFDSEAREYIENGDNPLDFPSLQFTQSAEESKALNSRTDSAIIISASGMCEAGRIKHHLKHNLWRSDSTVIFVGYQAQGTLGRKLADGAKKVRIFGEEINVNARIEMISGLSGHADKEGLLGWIGKFKKRPSKIYLTHGEEEAINELSASINARFGIETVIPSIGETFIIRKEKAQEVSFETPAGIVPSPLSNYKYTRLEVMGILDDINYKLAEVADLVRNKLKQEQHETDIEELKSKLIDIEKALSGIADRADVA